jgi:hypothetical protein
MTGEAMESGLTKRTAHQIRAAAIRLARERAEQDADPSLAYGCVDWFRYDVSLPPREADKAVLSAAAQRAAGRDGASLGH